MGNTYSVEKSKDEEIVIAQNGANKATASNDNYKLEVLNITVTIMAVIIFVFCALLVYKYCVKNVKKVLRRELMLNQGTNLNVLSHQKVPNINVC